MLHFLVTDDQHIGNLLQLGLANLEAQLLVAEIVLYPHTSCPKLCEHILGKRNMIVRYGHKDGLYR